VNKHKFKWVKLFFRHKVAPDTQQAKVLWISESEGGQWGIKV